MTGPTNPTGPTSPTGPTGLATPTTVGMAGWARDDIIEAGALLLAAVRDIDVRHYSDSPTSWFYGQPVDQLAETVVDLAGTVVDLAGRLHTAAAAARAAVTAALARRDWLAAGRPLWCIGCGEPIEAIGVAGQSWRVCRGLPEHLWCHRDDPTAEDADRTIAVAEAEHAAWMEDRARTGGPRPGDVVKVTYPDGTSTYAVWQTGPGGAAAARSDDYHARPVDLATAAGVEIVELVEDAWTPPVDGIPVEQDYFDLALYDLTVSCGACHQPLARPAVWARGYPVHQHCLAGGPEPDTRTS